jgi:hypothetical protein
LKLQILVSESKASVARRRSFAARSVDEAGGTGIGASTDIRASTMESAGSDFLTAIENLLFPHGQRRARTQKPHHANNSS